MTALAKDPHQRFGSVRAFANALEQASQSSDAFTFIRPSAQLSAPMSLVQPPIMPIQPSQQIQSVQLPTNLSTSQSGPISGQPVNQAPTPTVTPPQVLTPNRSRKLATQSGMQSKPVDKLNKKGKTRRGLLIGMAALTGLIGIGEIAGWYEFCEEACWKLVLYVSRAF